MAKEKRTYQDRKEWYKEYRKKNKSLFRNIDLKRKFGISLEEYEKLNIAQDFKCAICQKHESEFKIKFAVDHNHETKAIRGLLCKDCNTGIGLFKDDITLLLSAINYLKPKT